MPSDRNSVPTQDHELEYLLEKWNRSGNSQNKKPPKAIIGEFKKDRKYAPHNTANFHKYIKDKNKKSLPRVTGITVKAAGKKAKPSAKVDAVSVIRRNNPIYFKPASEEIETGEMAKVKKIKEALSMLKSGNVILEGHTASAYRPDIEIPLSVKRAKKIQALLSGTGHIQFSIKGRGAPKNSSPELSKDKKKLLRKVEVRLLSR